MSDRPLCGMPWHALTVTGQGDIKPCCQLKTTFGNIHKGDSLLSARQSPAAQTLRRQLLTHEKPTACVSCWQREKGIGESRRTWFETKFQKHLPPEESSDAEGRLLQMDLNLSNRCNLKCRMCGTWGSHSWVHDEIALGAIDPEFRRETRPERLRTFGMTEAQIDEIFPSLQHLRRLDFKGGEPMMTRTHPYLLDKLIKAKLHQQIELSYTTNGTITNPVIIDKLKKFKSVRLTISIEAIGPLYSYIRGGRFSIDDLRETLKIYSALENVSISFNVATQAYNALYLRDLWQFLNSLDMPRVSAKDAFKYTVVNDPAYLSPWILPRELKVLAAQRIEDIPELAEFRQRLLESADTPKLWQTFLRFTKHLDHLRNEDVASVIPEMIPYVDTLPDDMNPREHSTLCVMPWASLSIGTQGEVLRCQMSREPMGYLADDRLTDIINNSKYRSLRANMRRGIWDTGKDQPGCSPCKLREEKNVASKRQNMRTSNWAEDLWRPSTFRTNSVQQIYHLDLAFNSVCNFRCRMCNSAFSTRWKKDEDELDQKGFKIPGRKPIQLADRAIDILGELRSVLPHLQSLRKLEIVGGEPFLIPEFFEFIMELKRNGIWKNIDFLITTNGSLIKDEYLDLIDGCRSVNLNISADATGPLFEYMRSSGACTWEKFERNVQDSVNYINRKMVSPKTLWRLNLNGAFQLYNVLNVGEFLRWTLTTLQLDHPSLPLKRFHRPTIEHRLLMFPTFLRANLAPLEVKLEALSQIEKITDEFPWLINTKAVEHKYIKDIQTVLAEETDPMLTAPLWNDFVSFTQSLDELRGENCLTILPWLRDHFYPATVPVPPEELRGF